MRMRDVNIGLLLESFLFVLQTFVTYYRDQTTETACLTEISSPASWVGFLYFVRSNFLAVYSTALLGC